MDANILVQHEIENIAHSSSTLIEGEPSLAKKTICARCLRLDFEKAFTDFQQLGDRSAYVTIDEMSILIEKLDRRDRFSSSSTCDLCCLLSRAYFEASTPLSLLDTYPTSERASNPSAEIESRHKYGFELRVFNLFEHLPGFSLHLAPRRRYSSPSLLVVRPISLDGLMCLPMGAPYKASILGQISYFDTSESRATVGGNIIPREFYALGARKWLDLCRAKHGTICNYPCGNISDLELIDCELLVVVPAPPQAQYVALSYVWGAAPMSYSDDRYILPKDLPASIMDAITVTKRLGYRYLWIDRFCIDQQNYVKKLKHIQQMDLIYSNAELTIIGAAGNGDDFGLPGVSTRPRSVQPTAKVGNIQFLSTLQAPEIAIKESVWATRAWTFQEAFLSRRRLVFLEEQVYFECHSMCCWESVSHSLDIVHQEVEQEEVESSSTTFISPGFFGNFGFRDLTNGKNSDIKDYWRYITLIYEYSKRSLSFPGDSLYAFLGIAKYFRNLHSNLLHLWGIPIFNPGPLVEQDSSTPFWDSFAPLLENSLVFGLTWKHMISCWEAKLTPPTRREAFPSWSWCGWGGPVLYENYVLIPQFSHQLANILLELDSGRLVKAADLFSNINLYDSLTEHPRALWFTAKVMPSEAIGPASNKVMLSEVPGLVNNNVLMCIYNQFPVFLHISTGSVNATQFIEGLRAGVYGLLWLSSDSALDFFLVVRWDAESASRVGVLTCKSIASVAEIWETKRIRLV